MFGMDRLMSGLTIFLVGACVLFALVLATVLQVRSLTETAAQSAREARDAYWEREIEKSNRVVLEQARQADEQLKTVEADASERIRRAEQRQISGEQENAKLGDSGTSCALDHARVRMLNN